MDAINLFDAIGYFTKLCTANKLAVQHEFHPCACSGINSLQEVLDEFRFHSAFFAVDDTNDGVTEQRSGGYFKKRTFTVFLLKSYTIDDMADRQASLNVCRQLFRQVHSRLIHDKENLDNEMIYMNTENIFSRELGKYFINGCTGLYFMVDVSEPTDLRYNEQEWME